MSVVCFVSYEIHPTNKGGCGVLLHHAAECLLRDGHEVVFLLDLPAHEFERFVSVDRLGFPGAERCRAYLVDRLCGGFPYGPHQVPNIFVWKALRFAHALERLREVERPDLVEFFEYCGPGYYAMTSRLFEPAAPADAPAPVLGVRLHTSIELLDDCSGTRFLDRDRFVMYGLERCALELAESVFTPSRSFYEHHYRRMYRLAPERVAVSQPPKLAFAPVRRRPDRRGPFRVAFFGRMYQFKGVDQLVHAGVALLLRRPDLACTFDLIGSDSTDSPWGGSYVEYLRTLIPARLRDRFLFPGHITHEQAAARLDDALVAVFPNRFESFCYALHEVYDAGVPVIANDLPAFREFFVHEENCLLYDGTTTGLVGALERMIDDDGLRARVTRPRAVATDPLGGVYDRPRALAPLAPGDPPGDELRVLALVLCEAHSAAPEEAPASRALARQSRPPDRVVRLLATTPDVEETLWLLGRAWHARDERGRPVEACDLATADALVILREGDALDPAWLERCARALRRRPGAPFAGSWSACGGRVRPGMLDIAPEVYPFEAGARPTRVLLRTEPGRLVLDLLDPNLGPLGEVGAIWEAIGRHGAPGVLDPRVLLRTADDDNEPAPPDALKYLLARHGHVFGDRFAILAGLLHEAAGARARGTPQAPAPVAVPPPAQAPPLHGVNGVNGVDRRLYVADELGGRTLLRLALRKAVRRIARPPGAGGYTGAP